MESGIFYHVFIEKMLNILKNLELITEKQITITYLMVSSDLKIELPGCFYRTLILFLSKVKKILLVEYTCCTYRYDAIVLNNENEICILDWKSGDEHIEDKWQMQTYLNHFKIATYGHIIYLNKNKTTRLFYSDSHIKSNSLVSQTLDEISSFKELETPGLRMDYGYISYTTLICILIERPYIFPNNRWIKFFKSDLSLTVKRPALLILRNFVINYF